MHRLNSLPLEFLFALFAAAGAAAGQEVELLDFTADSCPACRQMEPILQEMVASGVPIRRVDVNRERELAVRFRIEYLPTFVVVAKGQEVERQVGATSPDRLREMIQRARAAAPMHESIVQERSQLPPPARQIAPANQWPIANSQPPATHSLPSDAGIPKLDAQLLASTVRLRVEDPQGVSYGTGTIIFAQHGQAIVVTCGHIFRESQGRAPVQVELFDASDSPQVREAVQGEVLGYDLTRDVGLVSIRSARPVQVSPIAPRDAILQPGDKAASVGCDHGSEPTVWHTRLTAINRYVGPANVEAARTPVQGRSGGGLFDGRGQLIGVCFAADDQGNEGLYVGLPAIYDELDRLQLTSVVATPAPGAVAANETLQPTDGTGLGDVGDGSMAQGVAASHALVPVASNDTLPASAQAASLTSGERAAFEEIGARSRGGEVIVIIRPKSPGDRCEILSLENPSQEFLGQLSALGNQATVPRFTSQRQPRRSTPSDNLRHSPAAPPSSSIESRLSTTEWTAVPPGQR